MVNLRFKTIWSKYFPVTPGNIDVDPDNDLIQQSNSEQELENDMIPRRHKSRHCSTSIFLALILLSLIVLPLIYIVHCIILVTTKSPDYSNELAHIQTDHIHTSVLSTNKPSDKLSHHLPNPPPPIQELCESIPDELKFDCYPQSPATMELCEKRGCCWQPTYIDDMLPKRSINKVVNVPYCYYPTRYGGYKHLNITNKPFGFTAFLERTFKSPYPNDVNLVQMDVMFATTDRLHVKIYDPLHTRYEVPIPKLPDTFITPSIRKYDVLVDEDGIGFQVIRMDSQQVIFDSQSIGGLIFADQFLQISSLLPSSYIYGIGEHRDRLLHSTDWKQYTLFARDGPPEENTNLYGSHPFYLVMEETGKSHGVFLFNSNAMDIILQPAPAITFRTIGGILDFYFFLGPTPSDVVSQYTELIGRPTMPPYWGLGFHLCRFNYGSLNETRKVWKRNRDAAIPFDVQWNDLDYMDNAKDFTYDHIKYQGLPEFVRELHQVGMHYIPLVDAGISAGEPPGTYPAYDEGIKLGIFIKNESGLPFIGKVWNPKATTWPDFTNPKSVNYWLEQLKGFHSQVDFDGIWLDMNEPSNFYSGTINGCPDNPLEYPPYLPSVGGKLFGRTICMSARQYDGKHYDLHNIFGFTETVVTNFALTTIRGKRPFIISRSTFSGQGHFGGHWTGDNAATWDDMKMSIPAILNFNLFGMPLVGADICGFRGNTTSALCERWMELGAFYPFSRNHNDDTSVDQDPAAFKTSAVLFASKRALDIRYSLLPYLYLLFWRAHAYGETVARPLFFEFPAEKETYPIDTQFMWGSALMIVPVLQENVTMVDAYLPEGVWYDFYTSTCIPSEGMVHTLEAESSTIPLLIRGGSIIPMQYPNQTTTQSRKNRFEFLVALDNQNRADGQLYWDDGDSIDTWEANLYNLLDLTSYNNTFASKVVHWKYTSKEESAILDKVIILGISQHVHSVTVNDIPKTFVSTSNTLNISNLELPLNKPVIIKWNILNHTVP